MSIVENARAHVQTPDLLTDVSVEMIAKDIGKLESAAAKLSRGTRISVTFLANEGFAVRVAAARRIRELGFTPISHISARRLKSEAELRDFLDALRSEARVEHCFVIAGDPPQPEGPFRDAEEVIRTGLLSRYGVKSVGIAAYPEGHPQIMPEKLWEALHAKQAALEEQGLRCWITTQFSFDAEAILGWLARARLKGVVVPVHVGVAGPASLKTLLSFAARCGVSASAKAISRYGLSVAQLFTTAGPDEIVRELANSVRLERHGTVRLHIYSFGGLEKAAAWIRAFDTSRAGVSVSRS